MTAKNNTNTGPDKTPDEILKEALMEVMHLRETEQITTEAARSLITHANQVYEMSKSKLERQILQLSDMANGLDIAIERAKDLRERFIFGHEPYETSDELTFSLDTLIELLRKDKAELEQNRKELQKKLA